MLYRKKYKIKGIVQGVGFRPFVYRLALAYHLKGWVLNDSSGVTIEIEGTQDAIDNLIDHLVTKPPPLATIDEITLIRANESKGEYTEFKIKHSDANAEREALISPDTNVCPACLEELFDSTNRRYRYPFINCTDCGPRYTIIKDIPYDRPLTTMNVFPMCEECYMEYDDPSNRRFHAQPNACWTCGPMVQLLNNDGKLIEVEDPIEETVNLLKQGKIIAVKGLGGYHLMVDPMNDTAIANLRQRKKRECKPFALMSETIEQIKKYAHVNEAEEKLLLGVERPIVLLQKRPFKNISSLIAPKNQDYGVMLAYTPLHYLLLRDNFMALIATSANITDEPIAYKDTDATKRLQKITDYFLIHNREIHIRADDSIVRHVPNLKPSHQTSIIRRARGYVPRAVMGKEAFPSVLALGAELKNTICLNKGNKFFLSQHIGDLKNLPVFNSMKEMIIHLSNILTIEPEYLVCDLHPDFLSTRYAFEQKKLPAMQVQHHHAHMASCMYENGLSTIAIGVVFDGVGYGSDGKAWGGEFLVGDYHDFERVAHFQYFKLLGGDKAVKEPYRIALAFLYDIYGYDLTELPISVVTNRADPALYILLKMAEKNINAPLTSSVGRIFDAVSALIDVRGLVEYEAQAAIELEHAIPHGVAIAQTLPYHIHDDNGVWQIDIHPMIQRIVESIQVRKGMQNILSLQFHQTIVKIVADICQRIRDARGINDVVLSGGVFLNQFILINCYENLTKLGFKVYTHTKVPATDGGLSLGQAVIAGYKIRN